MSASAALRRVGMAALGTLTDAQIKADPAGAMLLAMDAMRAALAARDRFAGGGKPIPP